VPFAHERLVVTQSAPGLPPGRCAFAAGVRAGARVFLSGQTALNAAGTVVGLGDAAAQTEAALDAIEAALAAAGGSLKDITKLTTSIGDRDHRKAVYETIGRRLAGVYPVSTGLVVAGLALPELMVQIDAEAVVPAAGAGAASAPVRRHRTFDMRDWFGQAIAWQGAMLVVGADEIFIRGQTGSSLDGKSMAGLGRRPEDAAAQADLALANLAMLLGEAGAGMDDVTKITVYISDRAYRPAVYPVIGKYFRGVHPVSTGIIVPGFARPEILFEIDVQAAPKAGGAPHTRVRPYHSKNARYGTEQQPLDCDFCMAVRAGRRIILRGQTGVDLHETLQGRGEAVAQARQAMDNVEVLLGEAGARLADVVKATVFVTDRAFLAGVCAAVLDRLQGHGPAFSALIVKGLASPELLMEVDITAVIADDPP
jgi:enamine deaminase RidA (YjgF/YER057c/UK114 family)